MTTTFLAYVLQQTGGGFDHCPVSRHWVWNAWPSNVEWILQLETSETRVWLIYMYMYSGIRSGKRLCYYFFKDI